jgi:hypothetical protein
MTTSTEELMIEFFRQATSALDNLSALDAPAESLGEIRERLLAKQTECLQTALNCFPSSTVDWTVQDLQGALSRCSVTEWQQHSACSVRQGMEGLNAAARLAFCRLVLSSESLHDESRSKRDLMISSGSSARCSMNRADVLEFCGLCCAAVKMPAVQRHLRMGTPLFEHRVSQSKTDTKTNILPQKRLECIQRMFLRALGYDPDHGTREIKRLFYDDACSCDEELRSTFATMAQQMEAFLMESAILATNGAFFAENDDSVTRVVSVAYSERLIDEATGQEIATTTATANADNAVPHPEPMVGQDNDNDVEPDNLSALSAADREHQRREEFRVARQAAVLQQEILGELLSMRDEERDIKLLRAKEIVDDVLQKAMQRPAGPERILFITSLDPATQRLMAMQKLWDGMLAANGGKPPNVRTQRPSEY